MLKHGQVDWFARFRSESRPTLTQKDLVRLPEYRLQSYLAVNRDYADKFSESNDDGASISFVAEKTGYSEEDVAVILWETSDLYDEVRRRWYHENTLAWKLFKRV